MKMNRSKLYAGLLLMAFSIMFATEYNRANAGQDQNGRIKHPTTIDQFREQTSSGLVLVDFYADWCGPCRRLGPTLSAVADEARNATIVKVNVDQHQGLARAFNVQSIPFLVLMKDGVIQDSKQGLQTKGGLLDWLNQAK